MNQHKIALVAAAIIVLAGCTQTAPSPETAASTTPTVTVPSDTVIPDTEEPTTEEPATAEPATEKTDVGAELFAELPEEFLFSSGVGAWGTTLQIRPDGSFSGSFHDANMGERGEDYPNGTVYACEFTGRFGAVEQFNGYTYVTHITELSYANDPETEEIIDGRLIRYATAYGLEGADDLYIYTPDAPLSELPDEFKSWYIGLNSRPQTETLDCYGIYNVNQQQGFFAKAS